MAVLLDTDVAIELLRGNVHALDCVAACEEDVFVYSFDQESAKREAQKESLPVFGQGK